jgi:hypothetical protein
VLFKVPRLPFEQKSSVFGGMFDLPMADGNQQEGCNDENPIRLESIYKLDFERLMTAMFPE